MLLKALHGRDAHVSPQEVFEGIDWTVVGQIPPGCPHSIWQIVHHLIYWQDFCLELLKGHNPPAPAHASDTWIAPMNPASAAEWKDTVNVFLAGMRKLADAIDSDLDEEVAALSGTSRVEILGSVMAHNSYHLGQVVLLRRMLGTWPPASGGDTW
ncbi:DinB family protein [Alicyclobacillus shizuokensis]|uniref:DinB family protein n=1 Tax=Alicyclobacillus shizuokensis TaxID=392014 RepID=UPI0035717880